VHASFAIAPLVVAALTCAPAAAQARKRATSRRAAEDRRGNLRAQLLAVHGARMLDPQGAADLRKFRAASASASSIR